MIKKLSSVFLNFFYFFSIFFFQLSLPLGLASGRRAGPASEFLLAREPRTSVLRSGKTAKTREGKLPQGASEKEPQKLAETNIFKGLLKKNKITRF